MELVQILWSLGSSKIEIHLPDLSQVITAAPTIACGCIRLCPRELPLLGCQSAHNASRALQWVLGDLLMHLGLIGRRAELVLRSLRGLAHVIRLTHS